MATRGGSMKSTSINGVKLYSIAGNRSYAAPLNPKKKRELRKDKDFQQRLDLIEDLKFETASTKIKVTPDGNYVIASGIYPPQVKVIELKELSLKFERHLVSEIVNFQILDDDYSKIAFLCADRSVCLHAKYGSHYSLRIPRMGRDITYDCWSCDLLCAASSPDLYRINLEKGRFLPALKSQSPALNVVSRSNVHGLIACGGEDGSVECFDLRKKCSVGRINACAHANDFDDEVTAVQFDESQGYQMAVGTNTGKVLIYDLRMSDPVRIKDHMYGSPILSIKWHQTLNASEPKMITSDKHIVRIWDPTTGDNMTSIEPNSGAINDVCIFRESGLMYLALDNSQIPAYFIPALGPAPKWCSHLETLTEEMEEGAQPVMYDDYKFLTREELERLNLTNLIGTKLLRAYMHGFFVDYRLYKKAQDLSNPFAYEQYLDEQKKKKLEKIQGSRITIVKKLPKVNRDLANQLLMQKEEESELPNSEDLNTKKKSKKNKGAGTQLLEDERFEAMFLNKDFEMDKLSAEYLSLHPQSAKSQTSLIEEHFEPVMENDGQSVSETDATGASESSGEETENTASNEKNARMRLYEIKDERHAEAFLRSKSLANEDKLPLGERITAVEKYQSSGPGNNVKFGPGGGSREISFTSRSSKRQNTDKPQGSKRQKTDNPQERRGIQSLGMKPSKSEFYAMKRGGQKSRGGRGKGKHRR